MKKAGMIAGIGPASTVVYYQSIIDQFRQRTGSGHYPEMLIHSIDMTAMLTLVNTKRPDELVDFLKSRIAVLEAGGADFAFMGSNTPHLVFERLAGEVKIPMISIVQACCSSVKERGLKHLGLLGTRSTMNSGFYQAEGKKHGIDMIIPEVEEQDFVHEKYMNELLYNRLLPATRHGLLSIIRKMIARDGIQGIILGGTELPLILKQTDLPDFPIFDTTQIHVARVVDFMLSE